MGEKWARDLPPANEMSREVWWTGPGGLGKITFLFPHVFFWVAVPSWPPLIYLSLCESICFLYRWSHFELDFLWLPFWKHPSWYVNIFWEIQCVNWYNKHYFIQLYPFILEADTAVFRDEETCWRSQKLTELGCKPRLFESRAWAL